MHAVAEKLRKIADEVGTMYLERTTALEALIVAILAKEHGMVLGPPGTAKSEMIRELVSRVTGAQHFETLLSRMRPEAAILGPYDIPQLRDKGDLKRKMNGFLPTANFAFLDEFGKMGPTLGNEMLAILNERIIHEVNGGRSSIPVPLVSMLAASNEVPINEHEDAAALYDRILVRLQVDHIQEPANFLKLMVNDDMAQASTRTTVTFEELLQAIDNEVPSVVIPQEVGELLVQLKAKLATAGLTFSTRRWRGCRKLLKSLAFLNGRTTVDEDDLRVLKHALWDLPEQVQPVERAVLSVSNPLTQEAMRLLDDVQAIRSGLVDRKGESDDKVGKYSIESSGKLAVIQSDAENLKTKYNGRNTAKVDEVLTEIAALRQELIAATLRL